MANALKKPCIQYHNTWIYPGEAPLSPILDRRTLEANDQIAGTAKYRYVIAKHQFLEVEIPWQSDALVTQWWSFWDNHAHLGGEFYFYDDSTVPKSGTPTSGDGTICGETDDSAGVTTWHVSLENDIEPQPTEVDGFWIISLRMRQVA